MIHIELVNDQRVMQSLQRAANALQHTGPLMAEIGGLLEANARERFDSKRDPAGHKWAAISKATRVIHRAITGKALGLISACAGEPQWQVGIGGAVGLVSASLARVEQALAVPAYQASNVFLGVQLKERKTLLVWAAQAAKKKAA